MTNIVAIIQARMGSTRLPGKVLADLDGQPMIERVVRRCEQIRALNDVVVAIPDSPSDDILADFLKSRHLAVFRGPEHDVLGRYRLAAETLNADVVVRITADCPLLDPDVSQEVIAAFLQAGADYASNTVMRTYPRGLDTEAFSIAALRRAARDATDPADREHVTRHIWRNPGTYRLLHVRARQDRSHLRWTVDTAEDLAFVRAVLTELRSMGSDFRYRDILTLLESRPDLARINAHVVQKPA